MTQPELLAPIADFTTCLAAVHSGCDAVYVGVPGWNARGRVPDLERNELKKIIDYCHLRNVRVFFAMNVLVFEREIRQLSDYLQELIALSPDAFIVQDPGLARLIKTIAPQQEIHASTQMTLSSLEAVQFVASLGFSRVVLARELSLEQIAHIRLNTDIELEVFVHGALCVSYSGQCLTSENFGGRSANRGQCAQSCRLPYDLWVDGMHNPRPAAPYLFSPKDLCTLDLVPQLMAIGVHSFKIEGRLKSPEYIAATTKAYREKIAGVTASQSQAQLESLFSRGFFSGWLQGVDHQKLVSGTNSSHQGILLGTVHQVARQKVWIRNPSVVPQAGDGCVLVQPEHADVGGRIYGVTSPDSQTLILEFSRDFPMAQIRPGAQVWRNDSPSLEKAIRQSWENKALHRTIPVTVHLNASSGQPLEIQLHSPTQKVTILSPLPLEAARSSVAPNWIDEELRKSGADPFVVVEVHPHIQGNPFLPQKMLRQLRQQALDQLIEQTLAAFTPPQISVKPINFPEPLTEAPTIPQLNVVVRHARQLAELPPDLAINTIFLDYDYGQPLRPSLDLIRERGYAGGIASLRIHKSGENKYLRQMVELQPEAILVRHWGALQYLRQHFSPEQLIADHSFNISNSLSAQWLWEQGVARILPAWDLNQEQLADLLSQNSGTKFEVALHQYLPTFHMEHCVFANALTDAPSYPECKVVCQRHSVEVADHKGQRHFLQSDAECRNTLYLGQAQSALQLYHNLRDLGVNFFRVDLLQESASQAAFKLQTYSAVLREQITVTQAYQQIGVHEKYGIGTGQLFNTTHWQDRKQQRS